MLVKLLKITEKFCGLVVEFWEIYYRHSSQIGLVVRNRFTLLNEDGADCHGRR